MIRSSKDLLDPFIQMWRMEERVFDIKGMMFPLQLHDIYFLTSLLIYKIQDLTHLSLGD